MKFPEHLSLKDATNRLEDSIITLSGPALAISGIIAGVDLLTGGNMLKQASWLSLTWAITLLLTLDFNVLSLGARAHKVYLSSDKSGGRKATEIVIAFVIAAAISMVSIQMQSIIARTSGSEITIDQAAAQLGINMIWLIWERSALVLVLIFMSGWLREERVEQPETISVPNVPPPPISDETVQIILAKLEKLDQFEQAFLSRPVVIQEASGTDDTPITLLDTPHETSETPEDEMSLEAQITALLTKVPDISSRDVAAIVGKPHSTVYRHLARLKQVKQSA